MSQTRQDADGPAPAIGPPPAPSRIPVSSRGRALRLALAALAGAVVVLGLAGGWGVVTPERILTHYGALRGLVDRHLVLALAAYCACYVGAAAVSFPGTILLTMVGGLLFGSVGGGAAALVSATVGACLLFLLARGLTQDWLGERIRSRLDGMTTAIGPDAAGVLLAARLIPVLPFWGVTISAALVGVPLRLFVATTFVGIAPATFAYASAGSALGGVLAERHGAWLACRRSGEGACAPEFTLGAVMTPGLLGALSVLALLAMLPVALRRLGIMPFSTRPESR